jgi:hypothetical protein
MTDKNLAMDLDKDLAMDLVNAGLLSISVYISMFGHPNNEYPKNQPNDPTIVSPKLLWSN